MTDTSDCDVFILLLVFMLSCTLTDYTSAVMGVTLVKDVISAFRFAFSRLTV